MGFEPTPWDRSAILPYAMSATVFTIMMKTKSTTKLTRDSSGVYSNVHLSENDTEGAQDVNKLLKMYLVLMYILEKYLVLKYFQITQRPYMKLIHNQNHLQILAENNDARTGTRTLDPQVKSLMLYQLSHPGIAK